MKLLAYVAAIPFVALLHGWALAVLWGWFVADTFGARPISWAEAYGLSLTASLALFGLARHDDRDGAEVVASAVIAPLLCLATGYLAHLLT